jgi:hypothetical protein
MGPRAPWGNCRALDRFRPWGIMCSIMTRGDGSRRGQSVLDVDMASCTFIQPVHYFVFQVFNFVFKSGDLGGEHVNRVLQVLDYSRKYINFDLSSESGSLFLI